MTLPESAVIQREGFSYVYCVGAENKVSQTKVGIGYRLDQHIEITNGIDNNARVVTTGASFLADGDTVRVVEVSDGSPGSQK